MHNIWRLIRYTSKLWRLYLAVTFFSVVIAILNQLAPLFTKGVIDELVGSLGGEQTINTNFVVLMVVLIFVSDLLSTLFSNIGGYFGDILAVRLKRILSTRYYKKLLNLDQAYFDRELTGSIISRLTRSIESISRFVNMFSNNFFQFILSTIFTLAIVAYYSWQVAVLLGLLYPIVLYLTHKTSEKWQVFQKKKNQNEDAASGRFTEVIGQIRVVKSFVKEKLELDYFDKKYQKILGLTRQQSRYWHQQDVYRRGVLNVIFFLVYAFTVQQTVNGNYSVGEMVLIIQYSQAIRIPIFSMSFIVDNTQRAIADSRDYFKVMEIEPDVRSHGNRKMKGKQAKLEFRNVDFKYESGHKVLSDISFTVRPGEKVALVGESGEGKSTITHLLLRLYDPVDGEILINNQDIKQYDINNLRKNIGFVFQESSLFSGTIKENIGYSKSRAGLDEVKEAAKQANADKFIEDLENGYESFIGERGIRLSGGQKQRIAIARAILKDPPILVLDEATSSLDSKAEVLVQQALNNLMKDRTTLIIAHRLSTIQNVDKIVVISKGRIVEQGSPAELKKTNGVYAKLLELQNVPFEKRKALLEKYDIS